MFSNKIQKIVLILIFLNININVLAQENSEQKQYQGSMEIHFASKANLANRMNYNKELILTKNFKSIITENIVFLKKNNIKIIESTEYLIDDKNILYYDLEDMIKLDNKNRQIFSNSGFGGLISSTGFDKRGIFLYSDKAETITDQKKYKTIITIYNLHHPSAIINQLINNINTIEILPPFFNGDTFYEDNLTFPLKREERLKNGYKEIFWEIVGDQDFICVDRVDQNNIVKFHLILKATGILEVDSNWNIIKTDTNINSELFLKIENDELNIESYNINFTTKIKKTEIFKEKIEEAFIMNLIKTNKNNEAFIMNLIDYLFEKNAINEDIVNIIMHELREKDYLNSITHKIVATISNEYPNKLEINKNSETYKKQQNYNIIFNSIITNVLNLQNKNLIKNIITNENYRLDYRKKALLNFIENEDLNEIDLEFIINKIDHKIISSHSKKLLEEYLIKSDIKIIEFFIDKSIITNKKTYLLISMNLIERKSKEINSPIEKIDIIINNNNADNNILKRGNIVKNNIVKYQEK